MKKEVRLYNAYFPLWMVQVFAPIAWLISALANFVIDSIVVLAVAAICRIASKKSFYCSSIWKVFLLGFLADFIGAGLMLFTSLVFHIAPSGDELYLTLPGMLFSAALIFIFNYFISFRKQKKGFRLKLALSLAIFTAPYTFLVPSSWLY